MLTFFLLYILVLIVYVKYDYLYLFGVD